MGQHRAHIGPVLGGGGRPEFQMTESAVALGVVGIDRLGGGGLGGVCVFLLVYRLVESIYLLCLAVSRLKGV